MDSIYGFMIILGCSPAKVFRIWDKLCPHKLYILPTSTNDVGEDTDIG